MEMLKLIGLYSLGVILIAVLGLGVMFTRWGERWELQQTLVMVLLGCFLSIPVLASLHFAYRFGWLGGLYGVFGIWFFLILGALIMRSLSWNVNSHRLWDFVYFGWLPGAVVVACFMLIKYLFFAVR